MPKVEINATVFVVLNNDNQDFQKTVLESLTGLKDLGAQIMAKIDDATAALKAINDATNQQAQVLGQEATSLQTISDNIDALIVQAQGSTITPELLAGLQAQADAAAAVSTSLQAHADFAAAIASKGAVTPVPVPVPEPTSDILPAQARK